MTTRAIGELDVYKRQEFKKTVSAKTKAIADNSLSLEAGDTVRINASYSPDGSVDFGLVAVSYTHLDVYKRQVRLPEKFRFNTDEVIVQQLGDAVILVPKESLWQTFMAAVSYTHLDVYKRQDLLGGTIKEMMEAEMDDHLGYEKSQRSDNDDYRNGRCV